MSTPIRLKEHETSGQITLNTQERDLVIAQKCIAGKLADHATAAIWAATNSSTPFSARSISWFI